MSVLFDNLFSMQFILYVFIMLATLLSSSFDISFTILIDIPFIVLFIIRIWMFFEYKSGYGLNTETGLAKILFSSRSDFLERLEIKARQVAKIGNCIVSVVDQLPTLLRASLHILRDI